ncbi:MAG: NAD(P)/FAD-dependent oxidoreductase [Desulfobacterales bacterium]|nr:NAD(P)/FAD-dependent oxidoreductase [Desulfobacterales bacterium]
MREFDALIVGSGTAGQTAAYDLQEKGLKVAVVEKSDRPGGTCALAGCQPKKWFYEVTETVARSKHLTGKGVAKAARGVWTTIQKQKSGFTSRIPSGTVKGLESAGIAYVKGNARFIDTGTLAVDGKSLKAGHIILATGARPMELPIEGNEYLATSDDFLGLKKLPRRIVFVGGGFVAFEFAHFAARLGLSNVRIDILEVTDRPLGPFDPEMVDLLMAASREEGIRVHTGIQITSIQKKAGETIIRTDPRRIFKADLVVHGAGRIPNVEFLDLEAGKIQYSKKGVTVDKGMKTSNPRVYAVGDCAATIQLARVADYEAHVAAKNILAEHGLSKSARIDYGAVPAVLFTYPQYGMVGKTEAALKQEGNDYRRSFEKNLGWPTYKRIGLKHAAYKILVGEENRILGAHFLSDNTGGLVHTLKLAMVNGIPADELYRQCIMSPYPTRESDLIYMLEPFLS